MLWLVRDLYYHNVTDHSVQYNGLVVLYHTGPSRLSSAQQNMLDDLQDTHDGSPTMKQCRGDDDTSDGTISL